MIKNKIQNLTMQMTKATNKIYQKYVLYDLNTLPFKGDPNY